MDEPEPRHLTAKSSIFTSWMVKVLGVIMVLSIFGITFALVLQVSHLGAVIVVVYFIAAFVGGVLSYYTKNKKLAQAREEAIRIQQAARERSGASLIGSAFHVAGDPKLEREQNIVLALTSTSLDFYPFDRDIPLDQVPLKQISAVHPVLYDDDRIPHLDTLDVTAQALQVTVNSNGVVFDILLRSFRSVRPVDWYQAIQKARMHVNREDNTSS